jgi:dolichol-phosphate mannosyltransferase
MMKKTQINFSIILPTLNESQNLHLLIPEIYTVLNESSQKSKFDFEVIVVDDNSDDDTHEVVNELIKVNKNLQIIIRSDLRSLSDSISDGIKLAQNEYVIWLDADGSMPPNTILELIETQIANKQQVIIGSRFVKGGGYKGISSEVKTSIFSAMLNVAKSKDSVLGLLLSIIFNKLLVLLMPTGVKDITSGFISIRKDYIDYDVFINKVYGEYFLYLITDLFKKKVSIKEIGYICETRVFGESKTAPNILKLIKRGLPYIKAGYNCRKDLNGYKR